MNLLYMVRNYVQYVLEHREMNKRAQKNSIKRYGFNLGMLIRINYMTHDLNKLFTRKFFDYVVAYDNVLHRGGIDFTHFDKVSNHDIWLLDNRESSKKLYRHIFRLMENNHGFNLKYLEYSAEILRKMAKRHGEDPIAVYFRHYHKFKLMGRDRFYFENYIGIDFDDYFGTIPEMSVEEILKMSLSKSLNHHIVYDLINNHDTNILQVLRIRESEVM